jgi:hypothetical protein
MKNVLRHTSFIGENITFSALFVNFYNEGDAAIGRDWKMPTSKALTGSLPAANPGVPGTASNDETVVEAAGSIEMAKLKK